MQVFKTSLPGVVVIEPKVFGDKRGCFFESYHEQRYQAAGMEGGFVQDNISYSTAGVLRGLHYQLRFPQGKLVTVLEGSVFDVAVDVRVGSPTFGRWYGCELSAENRRQLYIPCGFAHGFCVMSTTVCFHYKCTDYYHPEDEQGIAWNDSEIAITWPLSELPILSPKDERYVSLKDTPQNQLPVYEHSINR